MTEESGSTLQNAQLRRANLGRLLNPKHIAIIGGRDGVIVIDECRRIGYAGPIWPVNPKREQLNGLTCYPSVAELPEAPDAVFLAVPAKAAIDIVKQLAQMGAGGVVCYTAGFGADGHEGGASDQPLVDVVGDMALVGPNCYGLINYIDRVALWPFPHGGFNPGYGAAVITQSGMLSSDLTMNQRSLPLAYMISAGNQSVLKLEDYIEYLCERQEVRAIGLHIEGLKDIESFSRVARKALELGKPIVVLKTGTSKIGAQLTISHTGSLSGTNELYQALFKRLGIISVSNPGQLVETLKFICISGLPKGKRLMGFTCSGGGATMLADYAEKVGLSLPKPSTAATDQLVDLLPTIATVSNPLDYTTPIWGIPEKTLPVFSSALSDGYDASVIVQDYPLPGFDESKQFYLNDAGAFAEATRTAKVPAAVCSTLSENIDQATREWLVDQSIAPLQGIHEGLNAINSAIWYGRQRQIVLDHVSSELIPVQSLTTINQVDEWRGKQVLIKAGITVPKGRLVSGAEAGLAAEEIGFPVVVKMNSSQIAHKTEVGAVIVGLSSFEEVQDAVRDISANVGRLAPGLAVDQFLVEQMMPRPVVELMLDIRTDNQFGYVMTLSTGGVLIEIIADPVSLLLPASNQEILDALNQLSTAPVLDGYRGHQGVNKETLVTTISGLASYVTGEHANIAEIEINPLFVYPDEVVAVDVLAQYFV